MDRRPPVDFTWGDNYEQISASPWPSHRGWLPFLLQVRDHLPPLCPVSQAEGAVWTATEVVSWVRLGVFLCLLIFDPHYHARRKAVPQLGNVITGLAMVAIWNTQKNWVRGQGSKDVLAIMTGLLAAQLRVKLNIYKQMEQINIFRDIWGVSDVLCSVRKNYLIWNFWQVSNVSRVKFVHKCK